MKRYYRFIICFFKMWGTANWYVGIDKPNLWQWIYAWRISPATAFKVAKIIWGRANGCKTWWIEK